MALAAILRGVVGVLYGAQLWLTIDLSNPASIVSIFCALILSVLGVTFALYAVLGIVVAVRLGRGPALVIDDRGVTDRTALGSVGFIPWEQALAFIPGRGTHKGFVIVRYAHPQWPEERLRGLGRALLWVNRSLGRFGLPPRTHSNGHPRSRRRRNRQTPGGPACASPPRIAAGLRGRPPVPPSPMRR